MKYEIGQTIIINIFNNGKNVPNLLYNGKKAEIIEIHDKFRNAYLVKVLDAEIQMNLDADEILPLYSLGEHITINQAGRYYRRVGEIYLIKKNRYTVRVVGNYDINITLKENEILPLNRKPKSLLISFDNSEASCKFIDYIFAMKDGKGITIHIDTADKLIEGNKKFEEIKSKFGTLNTGLEEIKKILEK